MNIFFATDVDWIRVIPTNQLNKQLIKTRLY